MMRYKAVLTVAVQICGESPRACEFRKKIKKFPFLLVKEDFLCYNEKAQQTE